MLIVRKAWEEKLQNIQVMQPQKRHILLPDKGRMPIIERVGAYHGHRKVNLPSRLHPNPIL